MSKVLVIGGAGYVGSVVVEELLAAGFSVRVLDRLFFGRRSLASVLDSVELIVADMREINESHVEGCSAIICVGGLSNDPTAEFAPAANVELNTNATIRAAEIAKRCGVPRFVFASTCSIYDRGVGEEIKDILQDEKSPVEPQAAYATSKLAAEAALIPMATTEFVPVVFRKGTIFGFSPRMRYDLVLNTFVKDALSTGRLTIHYGGAMWRPLIDIRDVARAYVMVLQAPDDLVRGQIFNLSAGNFRISELALRAQRALRDVGVAVEVDADFGYRLVRSYRVSTDKTERVLGFKPQVTVEESIAHMVEQIRRNGFTDFSNPRYYNIEWMKVLEESVEIVATHGYVLTKPQTSASATPVERGDPQLVGRSTAAG